MGLNLSLLPPGGEWTPGMPAACPACHRMYAHLTPDDAVQAATARQGGCFTAVDGSQAVVAPLQDGILVAARECPCGQDQARLPLWERAEVARNLLASFLVALDEGLTGGQYAIELSTLRQLNKFILSLVRGEGVASDRALDLLLSAVVILLNAQGSWLDYDCGGHPRLLVKGNAALVASYRHTGSGHAVIQEVRDGPVRCVLGVVSPADPVQATALLPLIAQESAIVLEIERLFRLFQDQIIRVLGNVDSLVLLVDRHRRILYANPAAERLLGCRALDLVGRFATELSTPWKSALEANVMQRVGAAMDCLGEGDDARWVEWQVCPLPDESLPAGWLVLANDRTDFRRWQQAARQAERTATTAMLVSALAHELRTPLAATKGVLQLLERSKDPVRVTSYTELAIRELERMNRLLSDFLLLGRPATPAPEPLDLVLFLQELLPLMEGETAGTKVEIVTVLEPVPTIEADVGQLTQLLQNLVRNAVEAVGTHGSVTVSLRCAQDGVVLEVRDTGPGIPAGLLNRLFQPFVTNKGLGNGLGLAVSQAIVLNHGGRISAANGPDGGAVFCVWLPARPLAPARVSPVHVLLALSESAVRLAAEQALRTSGFSAVSSPDLVSLLDLARRYQPTVVVVEDSMLAAEKSKHLRQAFPRGRLLVIGAMGQSGGFKDLVFLPRPLDYAHLISQVHRLVTAAKQSS